MVIGYKVETIKNVSDLDKPPDEYNITIQGGIGLTIIVIYEGEFDDELNLSFVSEGFIIFAIDKGPTYTALCDGRIKMVYRTIMIGLGSLNIKVLIDDEVVKEAEGMMIGFFVFLD